MPDVARFCEEIGQITNVVAAARDMIADGSAIDLGQGGNATARLLQLVALLTILLLAPAIVIMVASSTRIILVLSFLHSALGLHQTLPNMV